MAGTSYSPKGGEKKEENKGASDIWLIKVSENGNEEWQRTLGSTGAQEAKSAVQTVDLGYVVASDVQHPRKGYGSKDVWLVKLDKKGKPTHEALLGGKGLDEVEKIIPTKDGGVLVAIYSRSGNASQLILKPEKVSVLKAGTQTDQFQNETTAVSGSDEFQHINTKVLAKKSVHLQLCRPFGKH